MKRLIGLCYLLACIFMGVACDQLRSSKIDLPSYNPYVEAFTTGKVSRFTSVCMVLSEEIPADRLKERPLDECLRIKPYVPGKWSIEEGRRLLFKPTKTWDRNSSYEVTANLAHWFDAEKDNQEFTFHFETLPSGLRAYEGDLSVSEPPASGFDLKAVLFTLDRESPQEIESLVRFSEPLNTSWQHTPDGKMHEVTLRNVPAGAKGKRWIIVSVESNKLGIETGNLLSMEVPGEQDFKVHDVRYVASPERFVEITFTKLLNERQEMRGLAFIEGNSSDMIQVERNKLRLYPDADLAGKGLLRVQINQGIQSAGGQQLEESMSRQLIVDAPKPAVRFVGNGVIVPRSEQVSIPFQAIYLRGVTVSVIKVGEQNIGHFLQSNQLDDNGDLMRVGRLVAYQTIFLDEEGADLSRWNTFAIDLKKLMEPEPGAIYRVELSFDRALSAYPGANNVEDQLSKEQIQARDVADFAKERERFDNGGYYYYRIYDYKAYNWEKRNDPCSDSYYYNRVEGKNVLVTDLGLMAMRGQDEQLIVLAHNIRTTLPEKKVRVEAYNYQHQLLASGQTDGDGRVELSLAKGKPFYLIASSGNQRSYLRVDDGSSLSLSAFDVAGEVVQKGIKGFIYGERGVWRPGDTLHLGFMLNDRSKRLPKEHPVVMELYNPLGQLYARQTRVKGLLGLYAFQIPTEADAPTGSWNAVVNVGGTSFSQRIRIESIKPNRLKINLSMPSQVLLCGEPLNAKLHVEWLQGAVASGLKYDIQGTFIATPTVFDRFKEFTFDNESRIYNTEESKLIAGRLDDKGNAVVGGSIQIGATAPGMLLGSLVTKAYEESGDFSMDATRILYSPYHRYAGIKSPQQGKDKLDTGRSHRFEVASVNANGIPQAGTNLEIAVYKVNWYWWWDADPRGLANYVSDVYNKPIRKFTLRTGRNGKSYFNLSFKDQEWGSYFVTVKDKESNHTAGIMSYFDWPYGEGRRDVNGGESAMMLRFQTDKEAYQPGDKMQVSFPSTEGARAVILIENGSRVLAIQEQECQAGTTTVPIDITSEMQPNAYVHISLLQPHGRVGNDLPIRLYGVVPFTVTSPESRLQPVIHAPKEIKPESSYTISISEKSGKEMAYTLAIVDEGLLDLTRFQTPDPWKSFNAREALGVNTWDLYNYVVGAYGGRIEQLFSIGGDDALNRGPKAIVNRFKPVVRFEGPFRLKKGTTATHTFRMPNYNGRVRIMAVAGNGEAYGQAEKSVVVRKPVMLLGTLPRVIGVGEEMVVPATVFATEPGVGDVQVSIACDSNMEVVGAKEQQVRFDKIGEQLVYFRIRVKDQPGVSKVRLTAVGKGERSLYETDLEIRTVRRPQVKVVAATLEPGASFDRVLQMPGASGTNSLGLEVSTIQPINLSARLSYLLDYPHGCVEQLVSKAFPQLYLTSFVDLTSAQSDQAEASVKEVIRRLRAYQTVDGAFSYWPGGTSAQGWATVYATHFLWAATQKGYAVPSTLWNNALAHLCRVVRNWKPVASPIQGSEEMTQAYRLYLLALAHSAELGAMNRMKEQPGLLPLSRWLLAAAYQLAGHKKVAAELMGKTAACSSVRQEYDDTFGSELRDQSLRLISLIVLGKEEEAAQLASQVAEDLSSDNWLSTQSTAFGLIALSDYFSRYPSDGEMAFTYACGGKDEEIRSKSALWSASLLEKADEKASVNVRNSGRSSLFVRLITSGLPAQGEEQAYAKGIDLQVRYYDLDGHVIQVDKLKQGTHFVAEVTVRNPSAKACERLVLTEVFPAGWEILNTRFAQEGGADTTAAGVNYQDIRDDRVYSYIDWLPAGRQLMVRIKLCAVYPGNFYLPPVYCEAMYDSLVRANTTGKRIEVY